MARSFTPGGERGRAYPELSVTTAATAKAWKEWRKCAKACKTKAAEVAGYEEV